MVCGGAVFPLSSRTIPTTPIETTIAETTADTPAATATVTTDIEPDFSCDRISSSLRDTCSTNELLA